MHFNFTKVVVLRSANFLAHDTFNRSQAEVFISSRGFNSNKMFRLVVWVEKTIERYVKICCKMPAWCMVCSVVFCSRHSLTVYHFCWKRFSHFSCNFVRARARFFTIYKIDYYYNSSVHKWRELQKKIDVDNHLNFRTKRPGLFFALPLPTLSSHRAYYYRQRNNINFIPRWRHFFTNNCPKNGLEYQLIYCFAHPFFLWIWI